jgi:dipeptidyl aminopeptidase/acylaminoacyl peptidase
VTDHQRSLVGLEFGTQEPFTWTASDGLELDGVLVRPRAARPGVPLPTAVLLHGGPYARWALGFHFEWIDWAQWLAMAGYAVLMPNPRGGLGHGESFAAAVRCDIGGIDHDDVMAAVDAAIDRGIADPDRLGIGGWSQGGFMAAWAVCQTTRFKTAVIGAGISHWGAMVMASDLPDVQRALAGGAPWDGAGPHSYDCRSPLSFASRVTTPVLILHGQEDARVPVEQAIGFHRALREQNVQAQLVVYPREGHLIAERAHQIDILRRTRAWFDMWIGR